ncbi:MAG TPA: DUF2207 domain-containing protein [Rhizomicrobium sp.]|nr:DUF2207 domain-containing protein [Rhizomicrobium sp.]
MKAALFALLLALFALPAVAQESNESRHQDGVTDESPAKPATPDTLRIPDVPDMSGLAQLDSSFEHITSFDSDITVAANGELTVAETISVIARDDQIKHGIYRDFPTRYKDKHGAAVHVRFDVVSVVMDGHDEPYTTDSIDNGVRVKIGDKDTTLTTGPHVFKLTYITSRQIGFFPNYDELYWNVTGNGWGFQIDQAAVTIRLPAKAKITQHSVYTGAAGSTDQNATSQEIAPNVIHFVTTRALQPNEGLTVAVGFNKGVIAPPSAAELQREFIRDNAGVIVALLGVFALAIFYLVTWWQHGRDPKRGTIIPLYNAPAGLSPEAVRYIHRMAYDRKAFAAALINMAVKGYLKISEAHGVYTLARTGKSETECGLAPGEIGMATALFTGDLKSSIELRQTNHSAVQSAISALQRSLKTECDKHYFITNGGWFAGGVAILLLTGLAAALLSEDGGGAVLVFLWLALWSVGTSFLLHQAWDKWATVFVGPGSRFMNFLSAIVVTVIAIPFSIGLLVGLFGFGTAVSAWAAFALCIGGVLVYIFHQLLKAPTVLGAQTLDQIDGFKMYLETAEKDRLEMLNPPAVTPAVFEKFLPYAIALDCENRWSKKFEQQASAAGFTQDQNYGYTPTWYSGNSFANLGTAGFISSIGSSVASAAASASTAPGSSSGSGGGGFSGGGGGGGGGGGW